MQPAAALRVAVQGTGHNANSLGSLAGTVLVKTSQMRSVVIDSDVGTARFEAGALCADVTAAAALPGLVGLAGIAAGVGVVGYTRRRPVLAGPQARPGREGSGERPTFCVQ